MNYNKPITIIANRPITPQSYSNIILKSDTKQIDTEFILLLNKFDFINDNILLQLLTIIDANKVIDGIYSDIITMVNNHPMIIVNLAYNSYYTSKYRPVGPLLFKNKFPSFDVLFSQAFLLHIPHILFHDGKINS